MSPPALSSPSRAHWCELTFSLTLPRHRVIPRVRLTNLQLINHPTQLLHFIITTPSNAEPLPPPPPPSSIVPLCRMPRSPPGCARASSACPCHLVEAPPWLMLLFPIVHAGEPGESAAPFLSLCCCVATHFSIKYIYLFWGTHASGAASPSPGPDYATRLP